MEGLKGMNVESDEALVIILNREESEFMLKGFRLLLTFFL